MYVCVGVCVTEQLHHARPNGSTTKRTPCNKQTFYYYQYMVGDRLSLLTSFVPFLSTCRQDHITHLLIIQCAFVSCVMSCGRMSQELLYTKNCVLGKSVLSNARGSIVFVYPSPKTKKNKH